MNSNEFIKKTHHKGTYAGVHFSESTQDRIAQFVMTHDIPNAVPADVLHSTLLYSRKRCPNYEPQGEINPALIGKPMEFNVWKSQDGKNCLVLTYKCPELVNRHKQLMDEHQATFDYDEYKPHVTFSYDIGDMQCEDLPAFTDDIEIVEEYSEELDLDWAENNTK